MNFNELWIVFIDLFFPAATFMAVGFAVIYLLAKFAGKVDIPGQGILLAAFAALGGVVGIATGACREPAVDAVLPALITIIAALLGYIFGKDEYSNWQPVIPYCLFVLLMTSLFGLFSGAVVRAKTEKFDREYGKAMLWYKQVDLEVEKTKELKELGLSSACSVSSNTLQQTPVGVTKFKH